MAAFAYYEGGDYDESITAAKRYVTLHPGSADAAYAQFLIGSSYFDRIPDISRDQDRTEKAVSELQGSYQVAAVDGNDTVSIKPIHVGDQVGSSWVVRDGLNPGERVIVDGIQKVGPGMLVKPKPARQSPAPGN